MVARVRRNLEREHVTPGPSTIGSALPSLPHVTLTAPEVAEGLSAHPACPLLLLRPRRRPC